MPKPFSMPLVARGRPTRCPASTRPLAAQQGFSAIRPTRVVEIVAVMRHAGAGLHAARLRALTSAKT